jgi:hypothetical protein
MIPVLAMEISLVDRRKGVRKPYAILGRIRCSGEDNSGKLGLTKRSKGIIFISHP